MVSSCRVCSCDWEFIGSDSSRPLLVCAGNRVQVASSKRSRAHWQVKRFGMRSGRDRMGAVGSIREVSGPRVNPHRRARVPDGLQRFAVQGHVHAFQVSTVFLCISREASDSEQRSQRLQIKIPCRIVFNSGRKHRRG
jgi:hypothetical protein